MCDWFPHLEASSERTEEEQLCSSGMLCSRVCNWEDDARSPVLPLRVLVIAGNPLSVLASIEASSTPVLLLQCMAREVLGTLIG